MEDCTVNINYHDFVIIFIGSGVGYFVLGYLLTSCLYKLKAQRNQDLPILARQVL